MTVILAVLLIVATATFVAWPFLREGEMERSGLDPLAALEAKKNELLQAMKEADFDLRMGKLSAADHELMQKRLREQALAVIASIEEAKHGNRSAERPAGKGARRISFCPLCGSRLAAAAKFCGGCGANLKQVVGAG